MNYEVQIAFFKPGEHEPDKIIAASFATLAEAYAEALDAFRQQASGDERAHVEQYPIPVGHAGIFASITHPQGQARARIVPLN